MLFKNDDFDDLFRKAARDYPLNTDNADWERVAASVNKPSIWKGSVLRKRAAQVALALAILGLGGGAWLYNNQSAETVSQVPNRQIPASEMDAGFDQVIPQAPTLADGARTAAANKSATGPSAGIQPDYSSQNSGVPATTALLYTDNASLPVYAALGMAATKPSLSAAGIRVQPSIQYQPLRVKQHAATEEVVELPAESNPGNDDDKDPLENATSKEASAIRLHQPPHFYRLYGSFFGGPEFSTVRFQQINKPGFKVGVSIGYRINKRLSLEVGLQREHLNFYSAGKYLDTTMLRIKSNTAIEDVSARSKLTSVPVALRYNFASKGSGHFFVTAGVNALIITHSEQYEYTISQDGVPADLSRYYSALTPPKYFSGINASAGYQLALPKFCSMKVESYYQAPVNNLGVGQLPVTSFGLNIGIVKNLK